MWSSDTSRLATDAALHPDTGSLLLAARAPGLDSTVLQPWLSTG